MKLTLTLSAAFVIGLSLMGCSATSTGSQVIPAKKIAFLLPSTSDGRYETKDRPIFEAKVQALCSSCEVIYRNANQDAATQLTQAEAALNSGAGVLVLDPVDSEAAAGIVAKAATHHVPVIAYDRLIQGAAGLGYYVSFDNEAIGSLQASRLLDALKGKTKATIVMINGDPADSNAKLFKQGAHSVLDGKVNVAEEYDTPSWSTASAQAEMTQSLVALQGKVDGVYAASDGLAAGAIAAIKKASVTPLPPVTGGDADLEAIQRILTGDQYMTVYMAIKQEAEAAAQLAYDLAYGVAVPPSMTAGKTTGNGARDVPTVLVTPQAVTRQTLISTVIADGFWTRADICTAQYAPACSAAGIS